MKNKYPLISPIYHVNKVNKGAIITNLATSSTRLINNTEALILSFCVGSYNISEIANEIAQIYQSYDAHNIKKRVEAYVIDEVKRNTLFVLDSRLELVSNTSSTLTDSYLNHIEDRTIIPHQLLTLSMSIIDDCPLNCIYCSQDANYEGIATQYIDLDTIKRAVLDASELGARILNLTGGEPFLHPNIFDIIRYAFEIGYYDIPLSTKATVIDSTIAKKIKQSGIKELQVSIDSFDRRIYEKMVGSKNKYDLMMSGLYHLVKQGVKVRVKSVITNINVESILEGIDILKSFGIKDWSMEVVVPIGRANYALLPKTNQVKILKDQISKVADLKIGLVHNGIDSTPPCASFISTLAVNSKGKVVICDKVDFVSERFDFGNIYNNGIKSIWSSEAVNNFRYKRNDITGCVNCSKTLCQGGCVLNSFLMGQDFFSGDLTCSKVYGESVPESAFLF
jgi:radical SAM protein with 4Fe4S-binding SPASM domain